jgi:PKHD-type hydroxylase
MFLTTQTKKASFITHPFVYWDNYFSPEELTAIEQYCKTLKTEQSESCVPGENHRKSDINYCFANNENQWIFRKLLFLTNTVNSEFFRYDLVGFDFFQYAEYNNVGSKYDYHCDMMLGDITSIDSALTRKLSFSILLSDPSEYQGGDLEFFVGKPDGDPDPEIAESLRGRVVAFPSYMMHRVRPLTSGCRRSLVFWALGPKFK